MSEVKWILTAEEFADEIESAGPTRSSSAGGGTDKISSDLRQAVMDALPKVLGRRIEAIWNAVEGFQLVSFEVKVGIEGKPFGVGIDGETRLRFERCKGLPIR